MMGTQMRKKVVVEEEQQNIVGNKDKHMNGDGKRETKQRMKQYMENNNNNNSKEPQRQQQQQLLDSKSAENVRLALEKMRQKEEASLQERSNDVYSKDFVPKKYAKNSAEYGRPPPGSLTEMRANKASRHVAREMLQLCEVIEEHGHRRKARQEAPNGAGGRVAISFGDLFNIYQFISDKVVGMLLRARKHGMVDFEGEMLFQRRDEAKLITLLLSHEQIQNALSDNSL